MSTRFDPDVNLVIIRCMTAMQYTVRVHKVLCCGLQRVDASLCGPNRVNTDINSLWTRYEIRPCVTVALVPNVKTGLGGFYVINWHAIAPFH